MIIVKDTQLTNFRDLKIEEELNDSLTLSFVSFDYENPAHSSLNEKEIVKVNDYDFRIEQIIETQYTKEVVAVSTLFDLAGIYTSEIYGGTRKVSEFLNFLFTGTEWNFKLTSTDFRVMIPNFGTDNKLKLLQGLCEVAEIEYRILPNNTVEVSNKVGGSKDGQYRYGYNTKTLNRKVDTSTMTTRISVYGLDGINVTYTSPASNTFGLIDAEPIRDERYTSKDVLLDVAKQSLQDYPLVSIEVDASETEHRTIGETVFLIYEPLQIDVKTRIMKRTLEYRAGELVVTSVTMGNHVPMTSTDLFAQQKLEYDENKKIQISRFEQTNDRITLAVEEMEIGLEENKALIEITAKEIRSEVTQVDKRLSDRITSNSSKITQTASEIRSEVNKEVKYLDGRIDSTNSKITQTASSITSEVNREVRRLDGRVDSTNSKITQTANQIRSEVGYELDKVDEKFIGVTSSISSIDQKADKIESTVTTIEQDVDDLGRTVKTHSSSISQMSNEISMKVSAGDIASEINQTAQSVKIRASKIQMDGIVELSDSVELGRSSSSRTKAIKFDGTGAWIYSNGSNLTISSNYLEIDAYTDALSPISNRRGGLALSPNGLWLGIQSDGSLRVSDGSQVRYYAPM